MLDNIEFECRAFAADPFGVDGKLGTEAFQAEQNAKTEALLHHVRGELQHAPKFRVVTAGLCFEIGETRRTPADKMPIDVV